MALHQLTSFTLGVPNLAETAAYYREFGLAVPQYQRAESYFAPLAGLGTGPDTELNFGIVPYHPGDQAPGTTGDQARLIDAALADSPDGTREWGVCTECGMGRAGREEMPVLLDLHRQILAGGSLTRA